MLVIFRKFRDLQELLVTDLVTLCWAVKAQGQGQSLERVARCEQRRRSSGMQELSIRRSEYSTVQYSTVQYSGMQELSFRRSDNI